MGPIRALSLVCLWVLALGACSSGTGAAVDASAPDANAVCGHDGQPCCPGNACAGGGCCLYNKCVGDGKMCSSAGDIVTGGTCVQGMCGSCGGLGQICCHNLIGSTFCTATGVTCLLTTERNECMACGRKGQPCCCFFYISSYDCMPEGTCLDADLSCRTGMCSAP